MADRFDPVVGFIVLMIAIFSVLLVILGWAQIYGGGWQTVAQGVAKFIIAIVVVAFIVSAIFMLAKRR